MKKSHVSRPVSAGFTLIELLVVIGIIGALVALTLLIGGAVVSGAKSRQTADTLKVLDNVLTEHRATTEAPVAWYVKAPAANNGPGWIVPLVDGVYQADTFAGSVQTKYQIPTLAWFLKDVTEYNLVSSAESLVNSIDAKFRVLNVEQTGNNTVTIDRMPGKRMEIRDAWGNPIRMVHPKFAGVIPSNNPVGNNGGGMQTLNNFVIPPSGGGTFIEPQFRRNYVSDADRAARKEAGQPVMRGDSDGGSCNGDTPYFYSAGPDGDPSTREDNVYSIRPKFADKN